MSTLAFNNKIMTLLRPKICVILACSLVIIFLSFSTLRSDFGASRVYFDFISEDIERILYIA